MTNAHGHENPQQDKGQKIKRSASPEGTWMAWRTLVRIVLVVMVGWVGWRGYRIYQDHLQEKKVLLQIIQRLKADSRIAEVLVTKVEFNPLIQKHMTTIKFLEYDTLGQPMQPKYFTFAGNIIQFQSLVIRFDDVYVERADELRGKSAYLFWKVFILDGEKTQEFIITEVNTVPDGYKMGGVKNAVEQRFWQEFWKFALDSDQAQSQGIKNAQIEAPGSKFVPGILYTLKIEHDGGIRIDTSEIPQIMRGEKILN
jgi:hypothetical protein